MTVGGQTEARAQLSSTIIDYHEPFDQGLMSRTMAVHVRYNFLYISLQQREMTNSEAREV